MYHLYADTRAEELAALNWDPARRETFVRMQFTAQRKGYRDMFPNAAFSMVQAGGQAIGQYGGRTGPKTRSAWSTWSCCRRGVVAASAHTC